MVGLNVTTLAYLLLFRNLKYYVLIPLTISTFYVSRNYAYKAALDRIYFPIYDLYREIREHKSATVEQPEGATEVKQIDKTVN